MMILSYIHRQELKTYVTSVVWPEMDKPIIHFPPPSSRDDNHFESEECDKLLPGEEVTVDQIEHLVARKKIEENNDQFDSGVSGSEYSGSGKSLPIYRLGYRLDFRRGSHASSGISSGGNSIKTTHTNINSIASSNHSGDSVLAKSIRLDSKFSLPTELPKTAPFAFNDLGLAPVQPQVVSRLTYVHQEPVMGYSVMDSNFGLKARPADMDQQMNYVGHGYVENTVFNMTNMPTAFIESFKKLKGFQAMAPVPVGNEVSYSDGQSEYVSEYEGYKPISALIPPQNGYQSDDYNKVVPLVARFNMPTFSPKSVPIQTANHLMPNFSDDEYPSNLISNLIPQQMRATSSGGTSLSDYSDGYNSAPLPSMMQQQKALSGYTGSSGYSTGESVETGKQETPMNDGYVADDGYNAGIINQMAMDGYVCDQLPTAFTPVQKIEQPLPPQPTQQVSGYLPFNRAMQTFGIDESIPDEYLLSSRLAAFQDNSYHGDNHMIPVSYVSGYTADGFMAIPDKKLAPGYLSIEGAELLQQS